MLSSGSTPNPRSRAPVPLWLLHAGEDHPKACTGRRLLRRHLVLPLSPTRTPRHRPLLLDPHATQPLAPSDLDLCRVVGVLGVDCSWNRLSDRGEYPAGAEWLARVRERRRLPFLVASNPQHYGRLAELNTAEAFAAALIVLGEPGRAVRLLDVFPGGGEFLKINGERLASYAAATSAADVESAEAHWFG